MSEQIDIDINVNMNNTEEVDELTLKLQEATSHAEELQDALDQAHLNGDDVEADIISDQLSDAEAEAERLQTELENISNTTVSPTVEIDNSSIDETNDKLQETESSASSLTTTMAGIAGVIGVNEMAATAGRVNDSWNRLDLTFSGTGVSMDELKNKSSQLASATGRSGGQVREYFNNMGIAGIQNTDLLASSFESIAGKAYQTNQPIEAMESKVQKMVMTGNAGSKMLTGLGLTTEDLAAALGVTKDEAAGAFEALSQEDRLQALTTAMGSGKEANDMYKNSYAGLQAQASTAMSGLMSAVGQGVLPVLNPMIQGATNLVKGFTDVFKSLPAPVKSVTGGFAGFLAGGTAIIGTLGIVGKVGSNVVGGLKSMKSGYDTVKGAMGTAKLMMDALRNSESITQGVRAALAIATGAEATAEGGAAAAKSAAIAPTTGLAIAENSLLLPLLLIVGAVIAVIAVMWHLYNTNETVRNGINWLISKIQAFIAGLQPVVSSIINFVTQGISNMNRLPVAIWNIFVRVISLVGQWAVSFIQKGVQTAQNFVTNVVNRIQSIDDGIRSALSGVFSIITSPFKQAYDYVNNTVIKPLQSAWDFITGFGDFEGFGDFNSDTLNSTLSTIAENSTNNNLTVNNTFTGLVEESAADYIVNAVNDRLRREKLLKGV